MQADQFDNLREEYERYRDDMVTALAAKSVRTVARWEIWTAQEWEKYEEEKSEHAARGRRPYPLSQCARMYSTQVTAAERQEA